MYSISYIWLNTNVNLIQNIIHKKINSSIDVFFEIQIQVALHLKTFYRVRIEPLGTELLTSSINNSAIFFI